MHLPLRAHAQEVARLFLGAEAHNPFDQRAAVPAPVEDHHLASGGKMHEITLHKHLRFFALCRDRKSDDSEYARAHAFGDPLDDATLSGGVASSKMITILRPLCFTHN